MAARTAQQTQQEARELNTKLRALQAEVARDKHALTSVEDNKIGEIVRRQNQLVDQVSKPKEAAIDAAIFAEVAGHGLDYVQMLARGGRSYNPADLLRRLKTHYVAETDAQEAGAEDPSAFDWAALGAAVAAAFRPAPVVFHMLGPMDARPKARKAAAQRQKKRGPVPVAEAVRPDELHAEDLQRQEQQETDRNMEEMWHVLRGAGGRAPMVDLVMNRQSFAQTVENLFTLSFLVRDEWVKLESSAEQGTVVVQLKREKRKQQQQQQQDGDAREAERVQFIVRLNFEDWEAWKAATDPGQPPMMHHRPEAHQQGGGGAGGGADEEEEEEEEQQQQQQQTQRGQQQRGEQRGIRRGRGAAAAAVKAEPAASPAAAAAAADDGDVIDLVDSEEAEEAVRPAAKRGRR